MDRYTAERDFTIAGLVLISNHIYRFAKAEREAAISQFMQALSGEYSR